MNFYRFHQENRTDTGTRTEILQPLLVALRAFIEDFSFESWIELSEVGYCLLNRGCPVFRVPWILDRSCLVSRVSWIQVRCWSVPWILNKGCPGSMGSGKK